MNKHQRSLVWAIGALAQNTNPDLCETLKGASKGNLRGAIGLLTLIAASEELPVHVTAAARAVRDEFRQVLRFAPGQILSSQPTNGHA